MLIPTIQGLYGVKSLDLVHLFPALIIAEEEDNSMKILLLRISSIE